RAEGPVCTEPCDVDDEDPRGDAERHQQAVGAPELRPPYTGERAQDGEETSIGAAASELSTCDDRGRCAEDDAARKREHDDENVHDKHPVHGIETLLEAIRDRLTQRPTAHKESPLTRHPVSGKRFPVMYTRDR